MCAAVGIHKRPQGASPPRHASANSDRALTRAAPSAPAAASARLWPCCNCCCHHSLPTPAQALPPVPRADKRGNGRVSRAPRLRPARHRVRARRRETRQARDRARAHLGLVTAHEDGTRARALWKRRRPALHARSVTPRHYSLPPFLPPSAPIAPDDRRCPLVPPAHAVPLRSPPRMRIRVRSLTQTSHPQDALKRMYFDI